MDVTERFLKYVAYDTQSKEEEKQVPSTQKQLVLARELEQELITMGAEHVRVSSHGYVFADIPATDKGGCPALGFIAHMDTSPACSGKHVTPQIIKNYDGKKIKLSGREGVSLTPEAFPELINYKGQDLITTDGTTLLGADDKAGIAEIMTMTEHLLRHPEISHGKICIGFTPDEEVGKGTAFFDVADFGADAAYTVDGGALGELEYENFNAATAKIQIYGVSIHTGSAKGQMKNALLIGMELQSMLPVFENPAATEGYEGFYHLDRMSGTVEQTDMVYLIRDHDMEKFEDKKRLLEQAAFYLNGKYGTGTILISIQDTYYNMLEKIKPHRYLIDLAKESMEELRITPKISPIRGGTDGARLSYMGLPCPNLGTGGHNFHGRYEFIPIRSMEKTVELLVKLAERFAARR